MEINTCFSGDVFSGLKEMRKQYRGQIKTCITSPPYFGLRDYGISDQIGLENTVEEYVSKLVEVFEIVKDLLSENGTLWLNLGDSYAGSGKGHYADNKAYPCGKQKSYKGATAGFLAKQQLSGCLKPKDLIGIPWRVAFALQQSGWYLRQDIIWNKTNAMPESVRDRCVKSHEYIFLLSKSKHYYFDFEAIKEPSAAASKKICGNRNNRDSFKRSNSKRGQLIPNQSAATHRNDRKEGNWDITKRNKRSIWAVSTCADKSIHVATFPKKLIEPCVLAGSNPGDIVLDPFLGSGTTALVATELHRNWLGCELNQDYIEIQKERLKPLSGF